MSSGELAIQQEIVRHQVHQLYSHHHGWLHTWLRNKLGCSHRAADLAQDTFVRLLVRDELGGIQEPRAYLTTIAQGMVANFYRRKNLEQAYLDALASQPEPLAPSAEIQAVMFETLVEIDRRLNTLPTLVRKVFLLSQLDGLRQADIAAQLGISVPTVKRYIAKALVLCCFDDE